MRNKYLHRAREFLHLHRKRLAMITIVIVLLIISAFFYFATGKKDSEHVSPDPASGKTSLDRKSENEGSETDKKDITAKKYSDSANKAEKNGDKEAEKTGKKSDTNTVKDKEEKTGNKSNMKNTNTSEENSNKMSEDRSDSMADEPVKEEKTDYAEEKERSENKDLHEHEWREITDTIHHDRISKEVYVVDREAYDEPVYADQAVYETYGIYVCNVCGAEIGSTAAECSAHGDLHMDWENESSDFSYHAEQRQVQTGTERVQVDTIHHTEKGHTETVVVCEAYDEVVVTGRICRICGQK